MHTFHVTLETRKTTWSEREAQEKTRIKKTIIRLPVFSDAAFLAACKKAFGIKKGSGWRQVKETLFAFNPENWQRKGWLKCAHVTKEEHGTKAA